MVNLSALENLTPLIINTSIVNNTETLIPNLISNTNTQTNNWFGLLVMLILFFYMLWVLTDQAQRFRLDFVKALTFSSGITLVIGSLMLVTDITTTYTHVVWFGIIFTLAIISTWFLKNQGG